MTDLKTKLKNSVITHQPILNANGDVVDSSGNPINMNDPLQAMMYWQQVALERLCDLIEQEYPKNNGVIYE